MNNGRDMFSEEKFERLELGIMWFGVHRFSNNSNNNNTHGAGIIYLGILSFMQHCWSTAS
jgi:hypothetical protein